MILVHGRADSTNVQKVLWVLDEIGRPFERIDRGGPFGGLDDPDYRTLNPNGRIPTVIDGPLVMWESNAILRHYAREAPKAGLFPADPAAAVRADMLLDWSTTTLWPGLRPAYFAVAAKGEAMTVPAVVASLTETEANLSILDGLLSDRCHAAGERFSIADIPLAIAVHRWCFLGRTLSPWPAVAAWYARCEARPPFGNRIFGRGPMPAT